MHQTRKENLWHFGMKVHIGVDSETGIVHSMSTTAANAHDVTEAHKPLHGGEAVVWGDAGYQGVHRREETQGLEVEWQAAMRPGRRRKLAPESQEALAEKVKASVRAKSLPSSPIGGGASLPEVQGSVRLRQGTLPGLDEEHTTAGAAVWIGQPANCGGPTGDVDAQPDPQPAHRAIHSPDGAKLQGLHVVQQSPDAGFRPLINRSETIQPIISLVQSILSSARAGGGRERLAKRPRTN